MWALFLSMVSGQRIASCLCDHPAGSCVAVVLFCFSCSQLAGLSSQLVSFVTRQGMFVWMRAVQRLSHSFVPSAHPDVIIMGQWCTAFLSFISLLVKGQCWLSTHVDTWMCLCSGLFRAVYFSWQHQTFWSHVFSEIFCTWCSIPVQVYQADIVSYKYTFLDTIQIFQVMP